MVIDIHKFGKVENMDSFTDNTSNNIYFPVLASSEIPYVILVKTEEMIEAMLCKYKSENGYIPELSELCLCARLVVSFNKEGKSIREISVVITGLDGCEDIWIENEYRIVKENTLYKPFKEYFMKKLENILFNG